MNLSENALSIIKKGAVMAGAATSAALTLRNSDPTGQVAASALGAVLPEVINDFANRFLSKREQTKIGAVEAFSLSGINRQLQAGKQFNPLFLNVEETIRPSCTELYEGMLIKAKNEHQEKKIPFIANVFTNSVFNQTIIPDDAIQALALVERLTYRQMCLMSLAGRKQEFSSYPLLDKPYLWYQAGVISQRTQVILQEYYELKNLGIFGNGNGSDNGSTVLVSGFMDLTPRDFYLSKPGELFFELMGLQEVEQEDVIPIACELTYKESYGKSRYG